MLLVSFSLVMVIPTHSTINAIDYLYIGLKNNHTHTHIHPSV